MKRLSILSLVSLTLASGIGPGCSDSGQSEKAEAAKRAEALEKLMTLGLDPNAPDFEAKARETRDTLIAEGNFADLEQLAQAVTVQIGDDRAWLRDLGMAQVFLGKAVEAQRFLQKSLQLDETSPDSHGYLALAYLLAQKDEAARGEFQHARGYAGAQQVTLAPIVEGFGIALLDGDFEQAREILEAYLGTPHWKDLFDRLSSSS